MGSMSCNLSSVAMDFLYVCLVLDFGLGHFLNGYCCDLYLYFFVMLVFFPQHILFGFMSSKVKLKYIYIGAFVFTHWLFRKGWIKQQQHQKSVVFFRPHFTNNYNLYQFLSYALRDANTFSVLTAVWHVLYQFMSINSFFLMWLKWFSSNLFYIL